MRKSALESLTLPEAAEVGILTGRIKADLGLVPGHLVGSGARRHLQGYLARARVAVRGIAGLNRDLHGAGDLIPA